MTQEYQRLGLVYKVFDDASFAADTAAFAAWVGQLREGSLTGEIDAKHAGYKSSAELMAELDSYPPGDIYRIALSFAGNRSRPKKRVRCSLSSKGT